MKNTRNKTKNTYPCTHGNVCSPILEACIVLGQAEHVAASLVIDSCTTGTISKSHYTSLSKELRRLDLRALELPPMVVLCLPMWLLGSPRPAPPGVDCGSPLWCGKYLEALGGPPRPLQGGLGGQQRACAWPGGPRCGSIFVLKDAYCKHTLDKHHSAGGELALLPVSTPATERPRNSLSRF